MTVTNCPENARLLVRLREDPLALHPAKFIISPFQFTPPHRIKVRNQIWTFSFLSNCMLLISPCGLAPTCVFFFPAQMPHTLERLEANLMYGGNLTKHWFDIITCSKESGLYCLLFHFLSWCISVEAEQFMCLLAFHKDLLLRRGKKSLAPYQLVSFCFGL